jgi:hypothetical protein
MLTFQDIATNLIPAAHELLEDNMGKFEKNNLYIWQNAAFNVEQTSDWENELVSMTSTRMWPAYNEQQALPFTEWDPTESTLMELTEYVDSFKVTRRYLRYGDAATAVAHVFPRLKQFIPNFLRRGLLRHSQLAGLVFLDAFNGAFFTTMASDGTLPLCATNHNNPTGGAALRNRIGNDLDLAGLTAAWNLFSTWVDAENVPLGSTPDTLIVGPNNAIPAWTLVKNTVLPGATNNERNPWAGIIDKIIVCPWLIDAVQAGAGQFWFLADSNAHTLTGYVGELPHLLDDPQISPMEMYIIGLTSGVYGWHDWRGIVGSDGSQT